MFYLCSKVLFRIIRMATLWNAAIFLYLLKLFSHLLVIWSGASVMMLMMMWWRSLGRRLSALCYFFRERFCLARKFSKNSTDTTPIRLTERSCFFVIATRSLSRRMPASPRGMRIRAGISKSVRDAESSVSMCSRYSSYLSNDVLVVSVCIIKRKVKSEGNHPLAKSNQ